jgi:hypothetical protein
MPSIQPQVALQSPFMTSRYMSYHPTSPPKILVVKYFDVYFKPSDSLAAVLCYMHYNKQILLIDGTAFRSGCLVLD